jgi:hypothetical protein
VSRSGGYWSFTALYAKLDESGVGVVQKSSIMFAQSRWGYGLRGYGDGVDGAPSGIEVP